MWPYFRPKQRVWSRCKFTIFELPKEPKLNHPFDRWVSRYDTALGERLHRISSNPAPWPGYKAKDRRKLPYCRWKSKNKRWDRRQNQHFWCIRVQKTGRNSRRLLVVWLVITSHERDLVKNRFGASLKLVLAWRDLGHAVHERSYAVRSSYESPVCRVHANRFEGQIYLS